MTIYLRDDFKTAWKGQDPYKILNEMNGDVVRSLEARRTYRFEFNNKGFFAKVHNGIGWKEIVENIIRFRAPVLGARNEWLALNKLHQLGIDTMIPVAFGEKGYNPAKQQSFLITEELEQMRSLEDICEQWKHSPPSIKLKRAIVTKLAELSRLLHDNGINHRDYYFCHFLIPTDNFENFVNDNKDNSKLRFFLIDLHRAQLHKILPTRWRLKDLSGLYFSSMNYGFTRNDILCFIRCYTRLSLKEGLVQHKSMWDNINTKAQKLYQRMVRKKGHPNY